MLDLKCPHCGSDHTQKITSIVDAGTTQHSGTTSGYTTGTGMVDGKIAFMSGTTTSKTRGTSKTALAMSLEQPKEKPVLGMAWEWFRYSFAGFMLFVIAGATVLDWIFPGFGNKSWPMLVAFLAVIAFGVKCFFDAVSNKTWNSEEYPSLIHRWTNGYFCHRCENIYVPTNK